MSQLEKEGLALIQTYSVYGTRSHTKMGTHPRII